MPPTVGLSPRFKRTVVASAASRLDFLDALRGFAAVAVLIHHAGSFLWPPFGDFLLTRCDLGNLGVVVFFLCSGFIIPVSLERHGSLGRFWVSRAFRLYPLYWFSILTILSWYAILLSHPPVSAHTSRVIEVFLQQLATSFATDPFGDALANLTMFQGVLGRPNLIQIYWTLLCEMLFYILVSALFVLGISKRSVPLAVAFLLMTLVIEAIIPLAFGVRFAGRLTGYLATMFVGTVFYRAHCGEVRARSAIAVVALAVLVLILAAAGDGIVVGSPWVYLNAMTARVGALAIFSLAFLSQGLRIPEPALYMGRISYSLYLMHVLVFALIPPLGGSITTFVLWLGGTLLLASATYYWIERPSIALGRHVAGMLERIYRAPAIVSG